MSKSADVIVIGGGVIGLACAWRLAQRGSRVVLLERGGCGDGASGAALGALIPASPTRNGAIQSLHRESLWMFESFAAELRETTGIDVEFERRGRLEPVHSQQRYQLAVEEVPTAKAWPHFTDEAMIELLSPEDARHVDADITPGEYGTLICRATAQVGIEPLLAALRAACVSAGVDLREHSDVQSLAIEGDRIHGVEIAEGQLAAEAVLLAAGVWTPLLSDAVKSAAPIKPVRGQAMLLEATDVRLPRLIRSPTTYLITRADGRIAVGATTEPKAGFDARPTAGGMVELSTGAMRASPPLEHAVVVHTWAGLRPRSADGRPYIGALDAVQGLFVASGHYKLGIGLAPLTAKVIADMIVDKRCDEALQPFRPGRGSD